MNTLHIGPAQLLYVLLYISITQTLSDQCCCAASIPGQMILAMMHGCPVCCTNQCLWQQVLCCSHLTLCHAYSFDASIATPWQQCSYTYLVSKTLLLRGLLCLLLCHIVLQVCQAVSSPRPTIAIGNDHCCGCAGGRELQASSAAAATAANAG